MWNYADILEKYQSVLEGLRIPSPSIEDARAQQKDLYHATGLRWAVVQERNGVSLHPIAVYDTLERIVMRLLVLVEQCC